MNEITVSYARCYRIICLVQYHGVLYMNMTEYHRNRRKTVEGIANQIHAHQRQTAKKRGYALPDYSAADLLIWLKKHPMFPQLFSNWKRNNYANELKPSCDRLDDYKSYTFSNLQLTTWAHNRARSHRDMKDGINKKRNTPVEQLTLAGQLIEKHYSIQQASRTTGISAGHICNVCKKNANTAGGFIWNYT